MSASPIFRSLFSPPCLSPLRPFLGALAGLLLATAALAPAVLAPAALADSAAVNVALSDELGPIESLEIGRTLFVRATGLASGAAVSLVVRDEREWPVANVDALADASGQTDAIEVWRRSGVVGCDCGSEVGTYQFARVEDAVRDLAGRKLTLGVLDQAGNLLTSSPLTLVETSRPLPFPSDAAGCPRFFLQGDEDLFLAVFGGSDEGLCEAELAPGSPGGEALFSQSPLGKSSASISWHGGGPSPQVELLLRANPSTPSELVLWFRCDGLVINSGLVIEDHSCPPPPPQPPMK